MRLRLETCAALTLFFERLVALRLHQSVGQVRLLFGFGAQPKTRINLAKLVVCGRILRIQLDDVDECVTGLRPILLRRAEFAEFKDRIGRLGLQLGCFFKRKR